MIAYRHVGLCLLVNSASLRSQLFLKKYLFVPNLLPVLASLRLAIRCASRRASARLFIYTQGHFSDSKNEDSRSHRFTPEPPFPPPPPPSPPQPFASLPS